MNITLEAHKRDLVGRKVKILRSAGNLPANVYGRGQDSVSVFVNSKVFTQTYKIAGETTIVELMIDGKKHPVLIHELQRHPVSDEIIHVDFLQVDLSQKISASIPVEIVGESPAEKSGIGTVVTHLNEIEVEALPSDLPKRFEVDAMLLDDVDKTIYVRDLVFDRQKVEIKENADSIVVKVEPPQKVEEVVAQQPSSEVPATEQTPAETASGDTSTDEKDKSSEK